MSKPKTHVIFILDKSGSMRGIKNQAINSFNEYVDEMKESAKDQDIYCSLITFNKHVWEHLWNVPASEMKKITEADYEPSGATAMRDAIGYTIQKMYDTTVGQYAEEDNVGYLVRIISDGETNEDEHYSAAGLKEMILACETTKKWTFTYAGCDSELLKKVQRETGISLSNMAQWSNESVGAATRSLKRTTERSKGYFAARSAGVCSVQNFYSDSKGFADYTADAVETSVTNGPVQNNGPVPVSVTSSPISVPVPQEVSNVTFNSILPQNNTVKTTKARKFEANSIFPEVVPTDILQNPTEPVVIRKISEILKELPKYDWVNVIK